MIHDEKDKSKQPSLCSHYCLVVIKDMTRLLRSQVTNHEKSFVFCLRCLSHFPDVERLRNHESLCSNNKETRIEIPKGNLQFKNHNRMIKVPFVVYADFEAIVKPINAHEPNSW